MTLPGNQAQALLKRAEEAAKNAYVPYSHFPVGAALLLNEDKVITGCNVENGSYGLTLCAERTAIVKAVSEGKRAIKAVAVWAEQTAHHSVTPCGACRQVLAEFLPAQSPVIFTHPKTGELVQMPLETLIPYTFSL